MLAFKDSLPGLDDLPDVIERAKVEMGLTNTGKAFSKDILRVEISGPAQPKFTVVDLPGLIHVDSKQQSAMDVQLISELVHSYMSNPRSVILAVVSAKNDYANQIILKKSRDVDPDGLRTLGLVTKPDTLPRGSESEAAFLDLVSNNDISFQLGWHVVRNRDFVTRHCSTQERDQVEEVFLSQGVWQALPREMVGIASLRRRLSKILLEQIKLYLPGLTADIQSNITDCKKRLLRLGSSRDTLEKQRQFLLELSQSFQSLCRSAIDGNYDNAFFGNHLCEDEYRKRIRAVVQNRNIDFSEYMRKSGHSWELVDEPKSPEVVKEDSADGPPLRFMRTEAVKWVRDLLKRSRGRELPGSYNPLLVGELFRARSNRWGDIARKHVKETWLESKRFLEQICSSIADEETAPALFTHWISPIADEKFQKANQALDRILADREAHPMTYNHYYTEILQDIRTERQTKEIETILKNHLTKATYVNHLVLRKWPNHLQPANWTWTISLAQNSLTARRLITRSP